MRRTFAAFTTGLLVFILYASLKHEISLGLKEAARKEEMHSALSRGVKQSSIEDDFHVDADQAFLNRMMFNFRKSDKEIDHKWKVTYQNKITDEEIARAAFYTRVSLPFQGVCRSLKRIGGEFFFNYWNAVDGDKFVCMDKFIRPQKKEDCLIYSFGINNEWSFEDFMTTLGCTIHAYDHTIDAEPMRGDQIHFHKKGLSNTTIPDMDTLANFIKENGDTGKTISYLKVDIEGWEHSVLPSWIREKTLKNVEQIGIEIHPLGRESYTKLNELMDALLEMNFRVVSYEVNMVVGKSPEGWHEFFEIVLMKDNVWNHLDG